MTQTVLFVFAGRRANMEIQMPFLKRILAENRNVVLHIWNLTRAPEDDRWLRTIRQSPRIRVMQNFHGLPPGRGFNEVFRYYDNPRFRGTTFVKLDDDVVFIETRRFRDFISAIASNPHAVYSANVINNGACTPVNPALNEAYRGLRIPLLDVHLHPRYAEAMHAWFLDNWRTMIDQPVNLTPTKDWLSINLIGYDYAMAQKIARMLDTQSPRMIAGRHFRGRAKIGDEGVVNTLPRIIVKGFTAGHLTFGPQEKKAPGIWTDLRKGYTEIAREYLS